MLPIGVLRGLLALLGLAFAFFFGRALARARRHEAKAGVTGWAIRLILALVAVSWRGGLDRFTITAILLAVIGIVLGFIIGGQAKKQEDLTNVIFPPDRK